MIAVNKPSLSGKELESVTECIRTGWISSEGHSIKEFEQVWAVYFGIKYDITGSNGTTALQVTKRCMDL